MFNVTFNKFVICIVEAGFQWWRELDYVEKKHKPVVRHYKIASKYCKLTRNTNEHKILTKSH